MSWTQTLVAAVLTAVLLFGGIAGLAVWAAPGWASVVLRSDHVGWTADRPRANRWYAGVGRHHGGARRHDICERMADFDVAFIQDYVADDLELNASQKADFNALVVAFSQTAARLQDGVCSVESGQQPLPDRFLRYAQMVDQTSEEMHALTPPLNQFYRGLSDEQRVKLEAVVNHQGRRG